MTLAARDGADLPATVHPTAIVEPGARLGLGVAVGPWCVVGASVSLGPGTRLGPHCAIEGRTTLGESCTLSSHVALGTAPQDLKYAGEDTELRVGDRNAFREFVTVNRGTAGGGGVTSLGKDNLFMTGSHVAHDCHVGNGVIFANSATLAGHVEVADFVTLGAFSAVHQFCRLGREAFVGGFTVATRDVLPFMRTVGGRGEVKAYGPNRIGLERRGYPAATIEALHSCFRTLRTLRSGFDEAVARLRAEHAGVAEAQELLEFVASARTRRGYHA